jgi:hypothetical protein
VWEGRSGEAPPYPDLWREADIEVYLLGKTRKAELKRNDPWRVEHLRISASARMRSAATSAIRRYRGMSGSNNDIVKLTRMTCPPKGTFAGLSIRR